MPESDTKSVSNSDKNGSVVALHLLKERQGLSFQEKILSNRIASLQEDVNKKSAILQSEFEDHTMFWMEHYRDMLDSVEVEVRLRTFKIDGSSATLLKEEAMACGEMSELAMTRELKMKLEADSEVFLRIFNVLPDVVKLNSVREKMFNFEVEVTLYYRCLKGDIDWESGKITRRCTDDDDDDLDSTS